MTGDLETFIVNVSDAQGRTLFTGSFQAATYHRALRIAWSETTDDRPLRSPVSPEPFISAPMLVPEHGALRVS